MKRAFLTALMVCLLIAPARAEEVTHQPVEDNIQASHVVVSTLDELQEAIVAADDGDTIEIAATIRVQNQEIVTSKDITLMRASNFTDCFFSLYNNSMVSGFTIIESTYKATTIYAGADSGETCIKKCTFIGECPDVSWFLSAFSGNTKIDKCAFLTIMIQQ